MRFNQHIMLGKWFFSLKFRIENTKGYHSTSGSYDLCSDGIHRTVYLDYDKVGRLPPEHLFSQLVSLQKRFKLSDFIVLQTDKTSYHCICFDMCSSLEVEKIINLTSCDTAFLEQYRMDYYGKVLRISQKGSKAPPKYVTTIESPYNKRKKSLGHIKFYESLLGIKIKNKKNAVKTGIWGIKYDTKKIY